VTALKALKAEADATIAAQAAELAACDAALRGAAAALEARDAAAAVEAAELRRALEAQTAAAETLAAQHGAALEENGALAKARLPSLHPLPPSSAALGPAARHLTSPRPTARHRNSLRLKAPSLPRCVEAKRPVLCQSRPSRAARRAL